MICISINQESRRLALVDMHNAAPQCDLLEVRLDRFGMSPELGELFAYKARPVIMSCHRRKEGGYWDGSEPERLALLRQCIQHKPEFIEVEMDAAKEIRKTPPTRRIISYTNLRETPDDIHDIYQKILQLDPDVIKLTCHARTPEEAWPLVQLLARPKIPTVIVGVGKAGIMLALLGKKIGAPFTFAALEKGMEAYPDEPTVHELNNIYHYPAIDKHTKLIGVTGFDERERITVAGLNAVFANLELPARCLPMGVGSIPLFAKVAEACKLPGVVIDELHQEAILETTKELHSAAQLAQAADVILHKGDHWHGFQTGIPIILAELAGALRTKTGHDDPFPNRMIMIVGLTHMAKVLAKELTRRKASVILASNRNKAMQDLAKELGCRQVKYEALYSTMHEVLIVCDEEKNYGPGLQGNFLKPSHVVMDLTSSVHATALQRTAEQRGCTVLTIRQRLLDQLELQAKLFTSKAVPRDVLSRTVAALLSDGGSGLDAWGKDAL